MHSVTKLIIELFLQFHSKHPQTSPILHYNLPHSSLIYANDETRNLLSLSNMI